MNNMRKAIIVFLIKDKNVLLLHSYYDSTKARIFWQGVSGFIEEAEAPAMAAVREVQEELGIVVDSQYLKEKHTFEANNISFTVFTLHNWQGEPKPLEQGIEELRWFPINQLPLKQMHSTDKNWLPKILVGAKHKRSSVILIFNDHGEFLLQRRAADDTSYPLHWDFSAAGGIEGDESPEKAAVRELREELGVEGLPTYIGTYLCKDELAEDQLYVFRLIYDGSFSPDSNEVEEVRFFSLQVIEKMLSSGEKFHPEFPFLWNKGVIK